MEKPMSARALIATLSLLLVALAANVAFADEGSDLCEDFEARLAGTNSECAAIATALNGFVDKHSARMHVFDDAAGGTDSACAKRIEPLLLTLSACIEHPDVSAAMVRLSAATEAAKNADVAAPPAADTPPAVAEVKAPVAQPVVVQPEVKLPPPPPSKADVAKLCGEWETSATKYEGKCSAMGKRLQRQFRTYDFTLRDVPRDGSSAKELDACTRAAKATSSCASDRSFKEAMKVLGN